MEEQGSGFASLHVLTLADSASARSLIDSAPRIVGRSGCLIRAMFTETCADDQRLPGWDVVSSDRLVVVLASWPDRVTRDAAHITLGHDAIEEGWHVNLVLCRSRGAIDGTDPFGGCRPSASLQSARGRPGVLVTWSNLDARWGSEFLAHRVRVTQTVEHADGALLSFGAARIDARRFGGFTITCWDELRQGLQFAYQSPSHREAMAWYTDEVMAVRSGVPESWFGRFVVESAGGSIGGVNPFAARLGQSTVRP